MSDVKFIRVNGRVVPVRSKGGATKNVGGRSVSKKADAYATKKAKQDYETKHRAKNESVGRRAAMGVAAAAFLGGAGAMFGASAGLLVKGAAMGVGKMAAKGSRNARKAKVLSGRAVSRGAIGGGVVGAALGAHAGNSKSPKNSTWKKSDYNRHLKDYQNKSGKK